MGNIHYLQRISGMLLYRDIEENMKYFKELSDEYLKKPFFIISEWMNKVATSPIPNEEILIRCCGFNKVIQQTKEIITSFINYEEEFSEYIKRGWRICFLPPIRLDENTNRLVDMSDFCKVKRFHEQ